MAAVVDDTCTGREGAEKDDAKDVDVDDEVDEEVEGAEDCCLTAEKEVIEAACEDRDSRRPCLAAIQSDAGSRQSPLLFP